MIGQHSPPCNHPRGVHSYFTVASRVVSGCFHARREVRQSTTQPRSPHVKQKSQQQQSQSQQHHRLESSALLLQRG